MEFSPKYPIGLQIYSVAIASVLQCIIRIDILNNWQSPHITSLSHRVKAIVAGRAKWKPLGIPLAIRIENQKQYHIPEEM